ncbi:hypothetical protein NBRC116493_08110 [Aurantivibrio infirmus]
MQANNKSSAKNILIATGAALIVACALLFIAILPAEFNIDPLGTGKLLGITGMSQDEQTVGALNRQDGEFFQDTYTVTLAAFESLEYKYRLDEGATMLFKWESTGGEVFFDMHSEKDGVSPEEYSPSFDQRQSAKEYGSYTAPFSGIHGWYWENRNTSTITITLNATGFFPQVTEFRDGFENERDFK